MHMFTARITKSLISELILLTAKRSRTVKTTAIKKGRINQAGEINENLGP